MASARKLTDIPSCMRMSFNFPWESSPEKEIDDPLSHNPPDIITDFEVIYGEGSAKDFILQASFPQTPKRGVNLLPVLQEESPLAADSSPILFELTLESPSKTQDSPVSSPSSPNRQRAISRNARACHAPYQRPLLCSPLDGHSSLPEDHGSVFHPQQSGRLPIKPLTSPSRPLRTKAPQRPDVLANLWCRWPGCKKRFPDKRTTERHRLTHLEHGMYMCPNPICDSHMKTRPGFASSFTLGRHLRQAAPNSPCAMWKGHKLSQFKLTNSDEVEALVRRKLVPFNPAIHTPFRI